MKVISLLLLSFCFLGQARAESPKISEICQKAPASSAYGGTGMAHTGSAPIVFLSHLTVDHLSGLGGAGGGGCSLTAFLLNATSPFATKHAVRSFVAPAELCGKLAAASSGFFALDLREFRFVCKAEELDADKKLADLENRTPREVAREIFPDTLPPLSARLEKFKKRGLSEESLADLHLPYAASEGGEVTIGLLFASGLVPAPLMEKAVRAYGLGELRETEREGEVLSALGLEKGRPARFVDLATGERIMLSPARVTLSAGPSDCTEPFNRPAVSVHLQLAKESVGAGKRNSRGRRMLLQLQPGFSVIESRDTKLRRQILAKVKAELDPDSTDPEGKILELRTPAGTVYLFPAAYSESHSAVFVFEKRGGAVVRYQVPIASDSECV